MGLEQGARTSFGEQSRRPVIKPPPGRLPWFDTQISGFSISRRSFLAGGLATAATALGLTRQVSAESPVDVDKEQLLSDKITELHAKAIAELGDNFDITGVQLSKIFPDKSGSVSALFQTMLVSLDNPTGRLTLRPLVTEIENTGYNTYLIPPFLGDPLPQKDVYTVDIPPQVAWTIDTLGNILGFKPVITGAMQFGGLGINSFRVGNVDSGEDMIGLIQYISGEQADLIRLAHTGHLALPAKVIAQDVMLAPGELATGGGAETRQIFETLQSGKGKQTEWVLQKSPDSPITPVVQRPDALAHVADTYLPNTGLKRVEIKFLPVFEGFRYNGLDFGSAGTSIYLSDSIYGPVVRFKGVIVKSGDTLALYYSIQEDKGYESLELMKGSQDRVNRVLSQSIGSEIAEAGGYNWRLTGKQAPEAWAMGLDDDPTPAIRLVVS